MCYNLLDEYTEIGPSKICDLMLAFVIFEHLF